MSDKYDVVVIGAGISGLVAGNYLAKAGLKVLIAEHHYAVGGCCSYFKRKGFNFDCGAHSLGSFRLGGQFDRVFKELGIINKIEIKKVSISDTILTKKIRLDFARSIDETTENISKIFPNDRKAVRDFLEQVNNFDTTNPKKSIDYYSKYKFSTFRNVLDGFFDNEELKSLLCAFLGNLGLPSTQLAALPGLVMLKEFVLDGGYYVDGGMQKFVEFLADSYKERGGELLLRNKVNRIVLKNGAVQGIDSEKKGFIRSDYVVSTTGPKQTFLELIERQFLPEKISSKLPQLKSSVSGIIMYLGVRKSPVNTKGWGRALWYVPENNADKIFGKVFNGGLDDEAGVLLLTFPSHYDKTMSPKGCESVSLFLTAPYKSPDYWKSEKAEIREKILHRVEEIIPGLGEMLVLEEFATPPTLVRYTLNDDGAMYGLASTPSQFKSTIMPQQTSINGLYLASHWATVGVGQGGTPMAAFAGRQVARLIEAKKLNKRDTTWVA